MSELKPCPFCGNSRLGATYTAVFGCPERYQIICTECSGRMERSTSRKAIEAWNRRVDNER